jgi:replicative DNA helicase
MKATDLITPPHSIEAEQGVLGGLMLDNSTWDLIADELDAADFFTSAHRLIFQSIQSLATTNAPFDVIIDDSSGLTPTAMRARARRAARRFGKPRLILVDYLQLMQCPGKENRNLEIASISSGLKALAKEFSCPVIALSQLNRSLENRPNKRPHNGDLRESGALEQDADLTLFIYRDEVYNPDTQDKGIAELIIGKHRNGPTGVVRTAFIPSQTRFTNLQPGARQEAYA